MKTNAAVITDFEQAPNYQEFELPEPQENQEVIKVVASGLHPRVKSAAAGKHYSSTGKLPMVPGIDGIGEKADGSFFYFVSDDTILGSMAEQTVINSHHAVPLSPEADHLKVAALMNPAMSSWVTFKKRVAIKEGQSVLILGATGNAGTAAVTIAKLHGAGKIIAVGRNEAQLETLKELGATSIVPLENIDKIVEVASEVDIVLDYLWAKPTEDVMKAILFARKDHSKPLKWVEIGSVAGAEITLPSAYLRKANIQILGSGQGSVAAHEYLEQLPELVDVISQGKIPMTVNEVPLQDGHEAWEIQDQPGERTVFTMK